MSFCHPVKPLSLLLTVLPYPVSPFASPTGSNFSIVNFVIFHLLQPIQSESPLVIIFPLFSPLFFPLECLLQQVFVCWLGLAVFFWLNEGAERKARERESTYQSTQNKVKFNYKNCFRVFPPPAWVSSSESTFPFVSCLGCVCVRAFECVRQFATVGTIVKKNWASSA